jgi:hypothetical protein
MTTMMIQSDKKKSKLIANLVKELGGKVLKIDKDILEDIALGEMMNNEKTNELVPRDLIMQKLRRNEN